MSVIFLDVDGVLTTSRTILNTSIDNNNDLNYNLYCYHSKPENYIVPLERNLINNLKYILQQTNGKIVISSTWRLIEEMKEFLIKSLIENGISSEDIIGETIRLGGGAGRGAEIRLWLNENSNIWTNFVIIDDEHMDNFKTYGLENHVVKTLILHEDDSSLEGLTMEHSQRAVEILLNSELKIE